MNLPTDTNPLVFVDLFLIESMVAALGYMRHQLGESTETLASKLLQEMHGRQHLTAIKIPVPLVERFLAEMEDYHWWTEWAWLVCALDKQLTLHGAKREKT